MRNYILATLLFLSVYCPVANAQDRVEATLSADFVSQYIWRGKELGKASIQPTLGISWKGLSLSAWGSMGLTTSEDAREFDLTASYTTGGLTLGIVDYWSGYSDTKYFDYRAHSTYHSFEGFIAYDFGIFRASWQTIFAGSDGVNKSGNRAYSSYAELTAPFQLATCNWEATAGIVPYATDSYDANGFAVTNVSLKATKDIKVTEHFSVPIYAQLIGNPCTEQAYFIVGLTLSIPQ